MFRFHSWVISLRKYKFTRRQRCDSSCGWPRLLPDKVQVQPFLRPQCGIWCRGARLYEGQNASTSGTRREGSHQQIRRFDWICRDRFLAAWIHHHICVHCHTCTFCTSFVQKESPLRWMPQPSHSRMIRLTTIFPILSSLTTGQRTGDPRCLRCASLTWVIPSCPAEPGNAGNV